jgi:3'-phosphoadenosine 5'-phosphosulfate sulfotransferase
VPTDETQRGTKTMLLAQGLDGYVRVTLPKGVVLKMRIAEYYKALEAGKAEARATHQARREEQAKAEQDANRLTWIE